MAHFAKMNDNLVVDIAVISNDVVDNLPFPESEPLGVAFLTEWSGGYPNWKQTSYNSSFRKNYAGPNYTYDAVLDAFIPPKPFPSWLLDTISCLWNAPVPCPDDGSIYRWDENTLSWVKDEN
jgi:hypothetical protein